MFHIIFRVSIQASWIELGDLKGASDGQQNVFPAVSGPLSAYSAGYQAWLQTQSYSRSAISDRLWQFDQLSRWLQREGLAVGELSVEQCERFAASRRAAGRVTLVAPRSMTLLLEYLRALGLTPPPARGPTEELVADLQPLPAGRVRPDSTHGI